MTKAIFISGAGAGIGRATALKFLAEGWRVGAFDINIEALDNLREVAQAGERLVTGVLDVTDAASWQQALASFAGDSGIDLLFNNAGILYSGAFETISLEAQQRMLRVNVEGVLAGSYAALPYLVRAGAQGVARVINMSSASAIYGQPSLASYSASKFAVRALTEALSIEWEAKNIQVMDIMPLFVQTSMVTDMDAGSIKCLGVRLTAEDIANTAFRMAHYRGNKVHWPVGWQTKLLALGAKVSPSWLTRFSNKHIGRNN